MNQYQIYDLHTDEQRQGAPEFCPMSGRQFWGHVDGIPTYGGPFDTYTIPEKDDEGEWSVRRFDQDAGSWVEGTETFDPEDGEVNP